MSFYCGIDPGKKGFVVALSKDGRDIRWARPIPTVLVGKTKRDYDVRGLKDLISDLSEARFVVIEKQQVMPSQGAVSGYTIGYGYGLLVMSLEGFVPYQEVRPKAWKKKLGLTEGAQALQGLSQALKKKRLKQRSVELAKRLFPNYSFVPKGCRVANSDLAEAALLAVYGFRERF